MSQQATTSTANRGERHVPKSDAARELEVANRLEDPFIRRSLKTALHVRRYLPFYAFSLVWLMLLAIFPTIQHRNDSDSSTFASNTAPTYAAPQAGPATAASPTGASGAPV